MIKRDFAALVSRTAAPEASTGHRVVYCGAPDHVGCSMEEIDTGRGAHRVIRRAGWWVTGVFWLVQFCELTIVAVVEGGAKTLLALGPRATIVVSGMILTTPIIEIAARTAYRPFRTRIVATIGTALAMCLLLVAVNYASLLIWRPAGPIHVDAVELVYSAFGWSWFFLGIAGAVVGLSYSLELRERERRFSAMEIVAKDARLAALQYQVNPHFLFNTLNSIAALIGGGDAGPAEEMTQSLADFLRATLELDPVDDIKLSQELQLQNLYLSIERVRFPDRLRARFDIDPSAAAALVPALITQPLVENAIRHGVTHSREPVTIMVSATVIGGRLHLRVENDCPDRSGAASRGAGVGLANVASRMRLRFGTYHSITAVRKDGAFRVHLEMPLREQILP